jgi:hypothetical protein
MARISWPRSRQWVANECRLLWREKTNEELWLFQIETLIGDVAGAVDEPLDPHSLWAGREEDDIALVNAGAQTFAQLRPGRIGLRSFGDPLSLGQQLRDKAGGPLRIVSGDGIADCLKVC